MIMNSMHLLFYFSNQNIRLMNMTRYITFFIENKNEIYDYECDLQNKENCFTILLLGCLDRTFC